MNYEDDWCVRDGTQSRTKSSSSTTATTTTAFVCFVCLLVSFVCRADEMLPPLLCSVARTSTTTTASTAVRGLFSESHKSASPSLTTVPEMKFSCPPSSLSL